MDLDDLLEEGEDDDDEYNGDLFRDDAENDPSVAVLSSCQS